MSESLAFKFGLDDHQVAFSHFLLCDHDNAMRVLKARKEAGIHEPVDGRRDMVYTATVFIDGVQIDAAVIEKELHRWYNGIEGQVRKEFSPEGFEQRVEAEVQKRLKEHADGVIEELDKLRDKLVESNELIKPYWKRQNEQA